MRTWFAIVAALAVAWAVPAKAAPIDMTASQFHLYRDYQEALQDSRVQRMPDSEQLQAVAHNLHTSRKELQEAISLGETYGKGIEKTCEKEMREELASTVLAGRVLDVEVDATDGHAVAYVEWRNDDSSKLEEEAATAALAASKAAPIVSTVAVWAKDASGRKVFEARINAAAAARFQKDKITMLAKARYIRVFEDVKNVYTGTLPTE